ncbi:hypothetical protein BJY16_006010 [Actinoplanes octamycinicus]|uniref:Uncharacterized protein n=1 Tax=Actinoplanes octamycinicus TaxID=135948 RepID=A0A7W7H210_9ACTN|nr:hypothetical protein [Actinoplanes octamycinicus]MBB4742551.1 hypothetical protein [Actinoplanes octamycinicus]GIE60888.1 hypothetical protein Aoc01nite_62900 [Actinoplanes octamycinicus]
MQLRHDIIRDERCLSRTVLAQRGWTAAAIRLFLGEPDLLCPHPETRHAPPVQLFRRARVLAAESSDQWQRWHHRSVQRAAQRRAAADVQRAAILCEIAALDIRVPVLDEPALTERALAFRRRRHPASAGDDPDPGSASLRRWMVGYLRHETIIQDCGSLQARAGRAQATPALRAIVYAAIADRYPSLADEARSQAAEACDLPP